MSGRKEIIKVGIVRPMSKIGDLHIDHWEEVEDIIKGSLKNSEKYDFDLELVSVSKEITLIHSAIVTNIHNLKLVICDISGLNPNVMFELGMRLAFDKAVIVIKDDETDYPFDITSLKYIEYDRKLNYKRKLKFELDILEGVEETIKIAENKDFSQFLKYYGKFESKSLEEKNGFIDKINDNIETILIQLSYMKDDIARIYDRNENDERKRWIRDNLFPNSKKE